MHVHITLVTVAKRQSPNVHLWLSGVNLHNRMLFIKTTIARGLGEWNGMLIAATLKRNFKKVIHPKLLA